MYSMSIFKQAIVTLKLRLQCLTSFQTALNHGLQVQDTMRQAELTYISHLLLTPSKLHAHANYLILKR